ncbi:PTS mannose transporter subunit EIIAB [Lactobacillus delbrueckii subsp. bulgaricus]|uniref:PTS sugar transporter subunit IIB n=1 Tax=Lactobacillus delbrueckii TaxID=1584 RepID=UPI001BFF3229|nr:PTS sugar transporter subunit IIB [Lactobacillus delbrueckii]MBT8941927.1 PTS mannose transporter subunit EIIAB [Lactobacillus delbrueckii subsp. bulgaricus]MCD5457145.1 PTS sugar transporter subunit IIB [Lactobacillus delbrueckii subsp. bulgaricus]MCD5479610.1 PTS sugar transporter subunit IIB [Lactobacillus delbrueckii subsp. bulgaricus]MCT3508396.1 PTS mannose transporter subunit IIAB [Lactobacillus delbrueckii subsp. bulgaricus]MCT3510976.1 PTS mannose transporter subunit IIAB [Lactobac
MVGIVLASHGGFADGIAESAQMLFGPQDNFAHVILKPSEGPEDIKGKMNEAIASFADQEEVLFLVDLWGGTPFNQANGLLDGHDKWAIVSGLNLPMVVEALTQRMINDKATAQDIATAIIKPAKDGIKTKPESLMPAEEKAAAPAAAAGAPKEAIPEGTVLGDGHIKIVGARIDSRLLHGQVATGWIPSLHPDRVIVVSDKIAKDDLRKSMIREAAPAGTVAHTVPLEKMKEIYEDPRFGTTHVFLLFENPEDALQTIKNGVDIKTLNVGSMSYSKGKVNANNVLSMDQTDVDTFRELEKMGIKFDVRKVPSDNPENMDSILKKAQSLLDEQSSSEKRS